jgi:hypothetical protein
MVQFKKTWRTPMCDTNWRYLINYVADGARYMTADDSQRLGRFDAIQLRHAADLIDQAINERETAPKSTKSFT